MTIWADADSLPREARELIGRRAAASKPSFPIAAVFVANRAIPLPPGLQVSSVITDGTVSGSADEYIEAHAVPGDIVVTRDLPLAERMVAKAVTALNDRGDAWTDDDIRERRSVRDHMAELRDLGLAPAVAKGRTYGPKEVKAFADALSAALDRLRREAGR